MCSGEDIILRAKMSYKLPVFKKFCCCIPLRVGVVIVGYWSIFSDVRTVGMLLLKYFLQQYLSKLLTIYWNIKILTTMTISTSSSGAGVSKLLVRAYMFRSLNVIVFVVHIVLSVMLLIGVRKKKPEYLRHFFVSCLVMTVVDAVVTGFAIVYLRHWMLSFGLAWFASNIYSLLIVRSAFLAMEEKEKGSRPCEEEEVCWDTMQLAHV